MPLLVACPPHDADTVLLAAFHGIIGIEPVATDETSVLNCASSDWIWLMSNCTCELMSLEVAVCAAANAGVTNPIIVKIVAICFEYFFIPGHYTCMSLPARPELGITMHSRNA